MVSLLILFCSATPNATGMVNFALLTNRVTFTVPRYWGASGPDGTDSLEVMVFCIPNPITEGSRDAANVAVEVLKPTSVDLRAYSDAKLARASTAFPITVLGDSTRADGVRAVWRRSRQGTTVYSLVDLFATSGGTVVHWFLALPHVDKLPAHWYTRVLAETEDMVGSFEVDGASLFPNLRLGIAAP